MQYKELTHISKTRNRKRDKLRSQLTKINIEIKNQKKI